MEEQFNTTEPNFSNTEDNAAIQPAETTTPTEPTAPVQQEESACCTPKKQCSCRCKIIFNVAVVIAIVVLYILHFCSSSKSSEISFAAGDSATTRVAYINTDSLLANYYLYDELNEELKAKQASYERDLQKRKQSLQTSMKNFQDNVQRGVLTQAQIENAQVKLAKEEQDLYALGQQYAQEIQATEYDMQKRMIDSVVAIAKRNNATIKADYILGYTYGGGIIYATDKYDITDMLIKKLNADK